MGGIDSGILMVDARQQKDLIQALAIIQGETYRLDFVFAGDLTGYVGAWQIRDKALQDSGVLLAEGEFAPEIYDEETDTTTFPGFLTDEKTAALPYTKYQGEGEINPRQVYHTDAEFTGPTGDVIKTRKSYVQVVPEVTGPGVPPEPIEQFVTEAPEDGTPYARQDAGWVPAPNSPRNGSGDMAKSVYDVDDTGVVDNSERLGGNLPADYLDRGNHTGTQTAATISDFNEGVSNNPDVAANKAKAGLETISLEWAGDAITGTGLIAHRLGYNLDAAGLILYVTDAPSGAAINVDLLVNGSSVGSLIISAGQTSSAPVTPSPVNWNQGDTLLVNVQQVGVDPNPGKNLQLVINGSRR